MNYTVRLDLCTRKILDRLSSELSGRVGDWSIVYAIRDRELGW